MALRIGRHLAVLAFALVAFAGAPAAAAADDCKPIDFLTVPVPERSHTPVLDSLLLAYEGIEMSPDGRRVGIEGIWLDLGEIRTIAPAERLLDPNVREQFVYRYPLSFDLTSRRTPYEDPGRLRNDAFFGALYFTTEAAARASLVTVHEPRMPGARFRVTTKHGVACQLRAALADLADEGRYAENFVRSGGGYNWRRISGTKRLSAHSFGIAIDIDPELGGYWRWAGARQGEVGAHASRVPPGLVRAMERRGFIWGGKWHHFDGMHFEYRPELILFSRMVGNED